MHASKDEFCNVVPVSSIDAKQFYQPSHIFNCWHIKKYVVKYCNLVQVYYCWYGSVSGNVRDPEDTSILKVNII